MRNSPRKTDAPGQQHSPQRAQAQQVAAGLSQAGPATRGPNCWGQRCLAAGICSLGTECAAAVGFGSGRGRLWARRDLNLELGAGAVAAAVGPPE